ncbi:hypothetical protein QFC22_002579 [Naganishia vaughanmartiniae]|uniref:Uncharacterized protein n=1 Tax=Naganishia vaughanmartiniae TaxID=1424756 RepID=A0ACC2XB56_9TREE|nr:hypothetical protein QFC22_002579 [Naganishia vaughanmartiniae]
MTSPHSYTPSLSTGGLVASPGINSPSTPGFGSPGTPLSSTVKQPRPPASTRIGGSHLNPALSVVKASTASRAGSGVAAGSVAATSVYQQQVSAEDFDKALDDFADRQVLELEVLLEQVLSGIDNAFDEGSSPAATELKFQQLQGTLQHLISTSRQSGIGGIPIALPPPSTQSAAQPQDITHTQLPTLSELAKQVERATEVCFDQRRSVRDGARAVCEIMKGAGTE